ncbi:hypothetical protein Q31b_58710 [Novipirellula aureliae]|uniref:Uncharacterized protein n=1 Tax=Novipirellula aureliae TaxID=2527966 RepID=A0A5C6D485_9BACT|nr:hypothetical protein Q31b_58710 [Novipirellula aureliae]
MLPQYYQAVNQFIEHRSYALRKPRGFGGWSPIPLEEQNRSLEILYFQTELDKPLDRC